MKQRAYVFFYSIIELIEKSIIEFIKNKFSTVGLQIISTNNKYLTVGDLMKCELCAQKRYKWQ